jgi:hypothetical protein
VIAEGMIADELQSESAVADIPRASAAARAEQAALWFLILVMAWAQFPLGSNRPWSLALFVMLVAINWVLWLPSFVLDSRPAAEMAKRLVLPGLLMLGVLVWSYIQLLPDTPAAWHHPAWHVVDRELGGPVKGAISLSPFETQTEWMKLVSYVAVGWLAAVMSLRFENARKLYLAVFFVGIGYALYGVLLSALGTSQVTLMEGLRSGNKRRLRREKQLRYLFRTLRANRTAAAGRSVAAPYRDEQRMAASRGNARSIWARKRDSLVRGVSAAGGCADRLCFPGRTSGHDLRPFRHVRSVIESVWKPQKFALDHPWRRFHGGCYRAADCDRRTIAPGPFRKSDRNAGLSGNASRDVGACMASALGSAHSGNGIGKLSGRIQLLRTALRAIRGGPRAH